MRTYEALYIFSPEVAEDDIQTKAAEVESQVTQHGGAIVRSEIWGRRRMAYEVKKFSEGYYVLLRFTANADFVARLDQYFRLNEAVIRFLVVHLDAQTLRLEEEQARRKREDIRSSARSDDDDDDDDDAPAGGARRYRGRDGGRDDDDDDDDVVYSGSRRPRGRSHRDDDDDD